MFWFLTVLLVIGAASFIIVPLLRKSGKVGVDRQQLNIAIFKDKLAEIEQDLSMGVISQEQFDAAEKDLRKTLAEDVSANVTQEGQEAEVIVDEDLANKRLLVMVLVLLPVISFSIYSKIGTSLEDIQANKAPAGGAPHQGMDVNQMIAQLKDDLEKEPTNAEGWVMLGRAYSISAKKQQKMELYKSAAEAYDRANSLLGSSDPNVLTDYADSLAMSTRSLSGRPMELVRKALIIQPFHHKALWLAGTEAYQVKNYKLAIEYWEKLKSVLKPDSEDAKMMARNIDEARKLLGGAIPAPMGQQQPIQQAQVPQSSTPAAGQASISGEVSIASILKQGASPSDTVFIYAKAAQGPPMPLAILRKQVKDLPMKFELNDAMAMNPAMKLSKFSKVVVLARVSKSGNAMTQSGDFQGSSQVIDVGSKDIKVQINSIVP